jgi:hypothetical protein
MAELLHSEYVPPPEDAETRHRRNRRTNTMTKGHPMTQATATPTTTTATPSGLRSLYLIRVVFSLIWVTLVLTTSASLKSADTPTVIAAVLLVIYPLWDVIATLLERRMAGTGSTGRVSAINVAVGLAATIGMIIAVFSTIGTALLAFGAFWFLVSAIALSLRARHAQR